MFGFDVNGIEGVCSSAHRTRPVTTLTVASRPRMSHPRRYVPPSSRIMAPHTVDESAVLRKVTLRLIPFMALLYLVAFLDRVNVGFAALTMNQDVGLSASAYGLGAGIFFIGYFLFEVPSNLILHRVGA